MLDNLAKIRADVQKYATAPEVKIVCATKTVSADVINALPSYGLFFAGENKVQEFLSKVDEVSGVSWHFIGNLQRNKVKYLIGKVVLIESISSKELLDEADKQSRKKGVVTDVLIEVNAGREASKGGAAIEDVDGLLAYASGLTNVRARGIMSVLPIGADESLYESVRLIYERNKEKYGLDILSMGMSGDYVTALRHGATEIRIGTALFGKRNYDEKRENQ